MIRDGNAVGVAGEIAQHMLWAAKRRLEVNHPFLPKQRAQEGSKGLLLLEGLESTGQNQLRVAFFQSGDELAAEDAAEHAARQEEVITRMNPASMIGRGSSGWNHTVNMWVMPSSRTIP